MGADALKFSKTHEWVRLEKGPDGRSLAVVGITAFALEALTDLVFVDLPQPGRAVKAGEPFGEIESVKAVSDLYSPVDGEVVAVNTALPDQLADLPKDPYGAGWFVKIAVSDPAPLARLLDEEAYRRQCQEEQSE